MIKALDLSRHQQGFRPETAKQQGVEYVMLRAAYGQNRDRLFETFSAACRQQGLAYGVYQFATWHYRQMNGRDALTAEKTMQLQLDALLRILKNHKLTGWVALDQELEQGFTMGLSPEENTRLLNLAAARLRAAGYAPCVYCSAAWLKSRILAHRLTCPVWLAYYYQSPADPDFDACLPIQQVDTAWGRYLAGLGSLCIGWQYGRIGQGEKYGVLSRNIDRSWFYRLPAPAERQPAAAPAAGTLTVTSSENPACEAFKIPDVRSAEPAALAPGSYPLVARGEEEQVGGMTGRWYQIEGKNPWVLALPDRCRVAEAGNTEAENTEGETAAPEAENAPNRQQLPGGILPEEATPCPAPGRLLVTLQLRPESLEKLARLLKAGELS